jgi:hypothetical protein
LVKYYHIIFAQSNNTPHLPPIRVVTPSIRNSYTTKDEQIVAQLNGLND